MHPALRLHPPVPLLVRESSSPTTLACTTGGRQREFSVAKGTVAFFNLHTAHRSQHVFGWDANHFRPDRWDESTQALEKEMLAFGLGPRVCLGRKWNQSFVCNIRLILPGDTATKTMVFIATEVLRRCKYMKPCRDDERMMKQVGFVFKPIHPDGFRVSVGRGDEEPARAPVRSS